MLAITDKMPSYKLTGRQQTTQLISADGTSLLLQIQHSVAFQTNNEQTQPTNNMLYSLQGSSINRRLQEIGMPCHWNDRKYINNNY